MRSVITQNKTTNITIVRHVVRFWMISRSHTPPDRLLRYFATPILYANTHLTVVVTLNTCILSALILWFGQRNPSLNNVHHFDDRVGKT